MKRIALALTFVAALAVAGLGWNSNAVADHGCYNDYGWYGHRAYYPAYYGGWGYPSVSYYHVHRLPRHHHHHGHRPHHRDRGGVYFSIGF